MQIPFMVTPMFVGSFAEPLGFIDVAWILGFVVSGLVYLRLTRLFPAREPVVADRT